MGKDQSFGSFKDLRNALGGGDEPEEEEEILDPVQAALAEWEDRVESLRPGVRDIIMACGRSFGPMEHGPPPYRDAASEEMELLASFRIRTVFPDAVKQEMASLPQDPDPADYEGRVDLRDRKIFTIDGEDAKDYDDAICIRELETGDLEVGVSIADVSHYVVPETALDREAMTRGTSVYLADQVVPMLPEELSNHLCSLVPHRDRLAFSVFMVFDREGRRKSFKVHKSVIKSAHRCTYKTVQELLDGVENEATKALAPIAAELHLFREWTRRQQLIRDQKGSLRLQSSERKFAFDKDHEVEKIYPSTTYFSQALIEETALAANQAVGDFFKERDLPTIYRIHPKKDPDEVAAMVEMLAKHGIRVPNKDNLSGRDVGRLVREARRRPNGEALISRIMGLVERATYEVAHAEDTAEHWGLARQHYLHFTSPIRRYPDLIVHRWLHDILSRKEAEDELLNPEQVAELCDVASHCSVQADLSGMVESAIGDLKVCQYMDRFEGEKLIATVQRVSPYGLEVFLKEHYVTGFIPSRSLEGRSKVEGGRYTLVSRRGTRVFDEGQPVEIVVVGVDFVRLQVLLQIADLVK